MKEHVPMITLFGFKFARISAVGGLEHKSYYVHSWVCVGDVNQLGKKVLKVIQSRLSEIISWNFKLI